MSKELKKFKKKARIVRKQIQKICIQCVLPCSLILFLSMNISNEQNIGISKPITEVVA